MITMNKQKIVKTIKKVYSVKQQLKIEASRPWTILKVNFYFPHKPSCIWNLKILLNQIYNAVVKSTNKQLILETAF